MVKYRPILSDVSSLPWFHPVNVQAQHPEALARMVEILEVAVREALPECRRRHPKPEPIPGALLSDMVRDLAAKIALSSAYEGQTLRAVYSTSANSVHLFTRDGSLRIRVRKMPNPEQPADDVQLQLPLFGENSPEGGLTDCRPELGLLWAVKGEALYRAVLAHPEGFEDEASLRKWHGAVNLAPPAVRTIVSPLGSWAGAAGFPAGEEEELDEQIRQKPRRDGRSTDAGPGQD